MSMDFEILKRKGTSFDVPHLTQKERFGLRPHQIYSRLGCSTDRYSLNLHSLLLPSSALLGGGRNVPSRASVARVQISRRQIGKAHLSMCLNWRRRRDLNSRADCSTYTLSRGASSPLEYFCIVKIKILNSLVAERVGFEPTVPFSITSFQD